MPGASSILKGVREIFLALLLGEARRRCDEGLIGDLVKDDSSGDELSLAENWRMFFGGVPRTSLLIRRSYVLSPPSSIT